MNQGREEARNYYVEVSSRHFSAYIYQDRRTRTEARKLKEQFDKLKDDATHCAVWSKGQ